MMSFSEYFGIYKKLWSRSISNFKVHATCDNLRTTYEDKNVYTWIDFITKGGEQQDAFDHPDVPKEIKPGLALTERSVAAISRLYTDREYRNHMIESYRLVVKPRTDKIRNFSDYIKAMRNNMGNISEGRKRN